MIDDQIADIIARQFNGTATPQDMAELQKWLDADASNRHEYEQMQLIWEKGATMHGTPTFNTAAAWAKVDSGIRHKGKEQPAMVFPLKRLAVAVVFLGAVFGGWYLWHHTQNNQQTIIAAESNTPVSLPDGTHVTLRKGSSIGYDKDFAGSFRKVQLKGEAFFEVEPMEKKPFLISTDYSTIKVLGTSFLVHSTDMGDEVIVSTGRVSFAGKQKEAPQVILSAGQKAVLTGNDLQQAAVSDSNFLSWKTGLLHFSNTPLLEALAEIADYYGIDISVAPAMQAEALKMHLTAKFDKQPLTEVLEEVKLFTGLETSTEVNKIIFHKK